MLDGVVFGGARGIVGDGHGEIERIAELSLEVGFPEPAARPIAAAVVGQDEQLTGAVVMVGTFAAPPLGDGMSGKARRVVGDADKDGAAVGEQIVDAVGDRHPDGIRAEVVVVPQAGAVDEWPEGLLEAEMRVASFQNGYFTALCNRVGTEEVLAFAGESFVTDPAGNLLAQAARQSEEILLCDLDLEQAKHSHARRLFLRDRRPRLYERWLGQ